MSGVTELWGGCSFPQNLGGGGDAEDAWKNVGIRATGSGPPRRYTCGEGGGGGGTPTLGGMSSYYYIHGTTSLSFKAFEDLVPCPSILPPTRWLSE